MWSTLSSWLSPESSRTGIRSCWKTRMRVSAPPYVPFLGDCAVRSLALHPPGYAEITAIFPPTITALDSHARTALILLAQYKCSSEVALFWRVSHLDRYPGLIHQLPMRILELTPR